MKDQRPHVAIHMRAGVGDAAIMSTKLRGIREAHPEARVRCYLNSPRPEVVRVLLDASPYLDEVRTTPYSRPLDERTADVIRAWADDGTFYHLDVLPLGASADGAQVAIDRIHPEIPFDPYPEVCFPGEVEQWADEIEAECRADGALLVGFHLHAIHGRPTDEDPRRYKEWSQPRWQRLADLLAGHAPCRIVLFGGPRDNWDVPEGPHVRNLIGWITAAQSLALARRLDMLVGVDSALKSCTLIFGVPTVMLWDERNPDPKECWFPDFYQRIEQNAVFSTTARAEEVFDFVHRHLPTPVGT
jgi:ADP-heptose:LPS heptosyltransferase